MDRFSQHINSRRTYHLALSGPAGDHQASEKPAWRIADQAYSNGDMAPHPMATLEVSPDGLRGTVIASGWPGRVVVGVMIKLGDRQSREERFEVDLQRVPEIALEDLKSKFTQLPLAGG
jgi:hypothetical protein